MSYSSLFRVLGWLAPLSKMSPQVPSFRFAMAPLVLPSLPQFKFCSRKNSWKHPVYDALPCFLLLNADFYQLYTKHLLIGDLIGLPCLLFICLMLVALIRLGIHWEQGICLSSSALCTSSWNNALSSGFSEYSLGKKKKSFKKIKKEEGERKEIAEISVCLSYCKVKFYSKMEQSLKWLLHLEQLIAVVRFTASTLFICFPIRNCALQGILFICIFLII